MSVTGSTPGLIISAPASGTGKTTVMLGLLRALTQDGVKVQPFKSGPDYIDPAFHRAACGRASFNLDTWAMDEALLGAIADQASSADMAIVEGAMGLYDGVVRKGASGTGSSADLTRRMGWPVVLVLDVSGQAQSAAATALGFRSLDPQVPFAGVILNRVASPRHERLVRSGLEMAGIPVLGALPRRMDLSLPERHLGLVQAAEQADLDQKIAEYAALLRANADLDAIRAAASASTPKARRDGAALPPSALPWPVTRPFPSSIPTCSKTGDVPGQRSCPFPRWRMKRHAVTRIWCGCPAAIPNCTPEPSPLRAHSSPACATMPRRGRSTANAAAIWFWARP